MTQRSLFSADWYRVAHLRPSLRRHAEVHRQEHRGDLWYVLQDRASGKFYRFSPAAYAIIGLMDGRRSMDEIWDAAGRQLGDDLPTQDEVIQILAQLHAADLLQADDMPDLHEVVDRAKRQGRRKTLQKVRNPLAIRLPLLDPDGFLSRTAWLVRPLFSWLGFGLWLLLVLYGLFQAGVHWEALTQSVLDRVLATENLLVLAVAYPLVKAVHELAHGYAVKRWGGEVHDMGIMFLVFMPVPYVDASDASAFPEKRRRIVVGAIGIMVELALAALAMIVWLNVEPGLVQAIAFNVMLIGSVSTLLINGNPLLRFDGYYVLADLLEIPNLGQRANRYVGYLCRRYLFGLRDADSPVTGRGERGWLFVYAVTAFLYRIFIMATIVLIVATKAFFLGVALAIWAVVMTLVVPAGKVVKYLLTSSELARRRTRALAASAALAAVLAAPFVAVPVPRATVTEGIVWVPEEARVRARASGFVHAVSAEPGQRVEAGAELIRLHAPSLVAAAHQARARVARFEARLNAARAGTPVEADVTRAQLRHSRKQLARREARVDALTVESRSTGRFVLNRAGDLKGRYVERGELLGYVLDSRQPYVRTVVGQDRISLVRERLESVSVRFARQPFRTYRARIARATPEASDVLPGMAFARAGGGTIPLDPTARQRLKALQSVFVLDLDVADGWRTDTYAGRVYVRFDHGTAPLALQGYRALRQLLLERFQV